MNKRIVLHSIIFLLLFIIIFAVSQSFLSPRFEYYSHLLIQTDQANTHPKITPNTGFPPYITFLPIIKFNVKAYYVSTNGNDNNPGTYDQPWRTFKKTTNIVGPGVAIYIRGGIYHEQLIIDKSGSEGRPIWILAYPGETPVIDGENYLPIQYGGLIEINGDWVQVSGLEVRYSQYQGVQLVGKHDLADNLFIHHNQLSGGYIFGDYGIFENSRIWRNSLINEFGKSKAVGGDWASGISSARDVTGGVTEFAIIRNNEVWENWGEGISTFESDHSVIENNKSHDNWATNIYLSDTTNSICQGNFVYMDPASYMYGGVGGGANVGIEMGDERYTPASANIKIINNIVYGNTRNWEWWQGRQGGGMNNVLIANNTFVNSTVTEFDIGEGPHQNVNIINNIFQQDGPLPITTVNDTVIVNYSNNLWSKQPPDYVIGPGDIIGDPLLLKEGSVFAPEWFMLTNVSPAISHALSLPEVTVDYFLNPRDTNPDMGAVEYISNK